MSIRVGRNDTHMADISSATRAGYRNVQNASSKPGRASPALTGRSQANRTEDAMHGVARNFFTLAIVYMLCGMALGLHMSIIHDHTQMPVHAHAMVAGWLMSAVFAFFYHLVPQAARLAAGSHAAFLADRRLRRHPA